MNNINNIIVGKIVCSHGILGWHKIISFTEKIENLFKYKPWFIKKNNKYEIINLKYWKYFNKKIIIKLDNVNNRNEADLLINYKIIINSSQLPRLNLNEYYLKDIIGCKVININNNYLGDVFDIIETKKNDILIIKNNNKHILNKNKILIPFIIKNIIKKVNLINKLIIVDWDFF